MNTSRRETPAAFDSGNVREGPPAAPCLRNVECYGHPEAASQMSGWDWLLVSFSGLEHMNLCLPGGRKLFSVTDDRPFAALIPACSHCEFSYGDTRENWVVKLESGTIAESANGPIQVNWAGLTADLSGFTWLDTAQAARCHELLTRLSEEYHGPEWRDSLPLCLSLGAVLDCVLDTMLHPPDSKDPAKALRDAIIADRGFVRTLADLSAKCGYSTDHLRRLFEARYGMPPKVFRTSYRMRLARDLLALGTLSAKEVSEQLSYSHPSHFSAAFRKHFGCPPGAMAGTHPVIE